MGFLGIGKDGMLKMSGDKEEPKEEVKTYQEEQVAEEQVAQDTVKETSTEVESKTVSQEPQKHLYRLDIFTSSSAKPVGFVIEKEDIMDSMINMLEKKILSDDINNRLTLIGNYWFVKDHIVGWRIVELNQDETTD